MAKTKKVTEQVDEIEKAKITEQADETAKAENNVAENTETKHTVSAEEKVNDPFCETVERNYPLSKNEDNFIYAEVNGRGYKVKRGMTVSVPKPIAEVIDNKLKADFEAYSFVEENKTED